ncbi:MAG: alcohol dehydrogenase family protein [Pseudomonadota bacterium]
MSDIPSTMRAVVLTGHGGMDKLEHHADWSVPVPGPKEVLIKVGACGMNNTDVNTRSAWYSKGVSDATTGDGFDGAEDDDATWGGAPITFPRIQGADPVGRIVAMGADVPQDLHGKRVLIDGWQRDWSDPLNMDKVRYFGSELDGGFAEYTKCDHRGVEVVESDLSDAELATFQCSYTTAEGMLTRANVAAEDTVLVPGASGGVGGALVQLAKARGARVIAMASEAKHADVAAFNPDRLLPRAPDDLRSALDGEKVTVVADVVGGAGFSALIGALERGGRYTCSGAIAGPVVDFDLRTFYLRDLTFTGSTVVPLGTLATVVRHIESGAIKPWLAATYPLSDFHAAQKAFITKTRAGNIVVTP